MTLQRLFPEPLVAIYAISKQFGLVPTSVYSRRAGGYINLPPVSRCDLHDPNDLAGELAVRLNAGVLEKDVSFEEACQGATIKNALNLPSMAAVEKKTVYITVAMAKGEFDLQIYGRSKSGTWSDAPYAVDVRIAKEQGFDILAKTIVEHLQTRDDLPDVAYIPSPPIAKRA